MFPVKRKGGKKGRKRKRKKPQAGQNNVLKISKSTFSKIHMKQQECIMLWAI